MTKDCVGNLPALTALSDDLVLGNAHIREKHLVEVCVTSHVDKGPNLNPWCVHFEKQKGNTLMFWRLRFGSDQAENPIG